MTSEIAAEPYIDVPPDPQRIIEGLRDTGYEFNTAMADVIDNSIAAKAKNIDVRVAMDFGGNIVVSVADDGCGMNRDGLVNAMRYGSAKRKDQASLGKFGLGLKTASTAFCRRLSAISRDQTEGEVLKATWDLDHVASVEKWHLQLEAASKGEIGLLDTVAAGGHGTLIIWEKVDRLLKAYALPDGAAAKKALKKYVEDLSFHIAMVYQRFLDIDDLRSSHITISVNGKKISPWDPFCVSLTKAPVAEKTQKVEVREGNFAEFTVRAFILPRKDEFADRDALSAVHLTNKMQGLFVYRENRLIHGPDWLGMYIKEPHMSLCRVELSFDHMLDDAFQVDIKKSRILLDEKLYDWMGTFLNGPRREAEQRYRKGVKQAVTGAAETLHAVSNNAIHQKAADLTNGASIQEVDGPSGNVTIANRHGVTKLKIKLVEEKHAGELHVQPVESLNDGLLWEPAFIEGNQGVRVNTGHPYYHKVYMPNRLASVTIQGLDSLLWGLASAELANVSESNKRNFEEMRYEVSRVLRRLVEDLPEPPEHDAASEGK